VKPELVDVEHDAGVIVKERWPKRPLIVTGSRDHSLRVWTLPRPGEPEYKCFGGDDVEVDPAEVCVCVLHLARLMSVELILDLIGRGGESISQSSSRRS
jgi:hypothetical protein